jgi:hypothetical protein
MKRVDGHDDRVRHTTARTLGTDALPQACMTEQGGDRQGYTEKWNRK